MKRLYSTGIVLLVMMLLIVQPTFAISQPPSDDLNRPSKWDIHKNYNADPFAFKPDRSGTTYLDPPSTTDFTKPGVVTPHHLETALRVVNFTRYLVGLPEDLTMSTTYNQYAQYASYMNLLTNTLSHTPTQLEGIPDDVYALGYKGASSSNLGLGFPTIADSIIRGYMEDSDTTNIDRVGHRRWLLNPKMSQIGFGYANRYTATYVFDTARTPTLFYEAITWPTAGYMPVEYLTSATPFSVNLGPHYDAPNINQVTVSLKDQATGITYTFNRHSNLDPKQSPNTDYFNINLSGFGMSNCIIFRPKPGSLNLSPGNRFDVTINGIYQNGIEEPYQYEIELFSLIDNPSRWSMSDLDTAIQHNLIPESQLADFKTPISRIDFAKTLIHFLKATLNVSNFDLQALSKRPYTEKPFNDTEDPDVAIAYALGIVNGVGYNLYDPNGAITRQEAAILLQRTAPYLGLLKNVPISTYPFLDQGDIATWALPGVDFVSHYTDSMTGQKIMEGTTLDHFSPLSNLTKEQSFVTFKRLYMARLKAIE